MTLIKSISGIRGTIGGTVGNNLTPADIVRFTTGYAAWLREQNTDAERLTVVVGRDARLSGAMVRNLIAGTLLGCGVNVIDVGMCTTPGVELAVVHHHAEGGIIITASHNPAQWNAMKLLGPAGEFLTDAEGRRVLQLAENENINYAEIEHIGQILESADFNPTHINMVLRLPQVDVEAVRKRKFRVIVDGINSVGGVVIPELLEQLGVEVIRLNCEPNGCFAHNPEPIAANLTEICEVVRREKADLGIVVDPDVDRLAFVDETGRLFGEEYTLVAVAEYIIQWTLLREKKSINTVSNLSSSRALKDVTEKYGGHYSAAAVGEVNVVAEMKKTGALIGGEGNGGVIFPELHYGRDALVGVALFLTYLAHKSVKVSELRTSLPIYFMAKQRLGLTPKISKDAILKMLKKHYSDEKISDIDGIKIDFTESWAHIRGSNTEPIIRIYTEAKTQQKAEELAEEIMQKIAENL